MSKIILNTFLIGALFLVTNCSGNKSVDLVESWEIGTSSGIFVDFSQEEFYQAKKDGIACLELSSRIFNDKTREESKELVRDIKRKADNAGLTIWSIHLPFSRKLDVSLDNNEDRNYMIEECSRLMELCGPFNLKKFVIHPSSEPISDEERPVRLKNSIESLKVLSNEAKKYNAQLAVEDLPRTCLGNTSAELLSIVKAVGNGIGICFDSNHMLQETPENFVSNAGNLIVTLHISDYDGVDERHWLPGDGIINWTNVISELVKCGYEGPFMFETSRRNPALLTANEPVTALKSKDLINCFQELKSNYLKSLK